MAKGCMSESYIVSDVTGLDVGSVCCVSGGCGLWDVGRRKSIFLVVTGSNLVQISGVVLGCDEAAGRASAGNWQSSGGGIGFSSRCCVTVCVGVDAICCVFLWMTRRQCQVAAVRL
eukprot:1846736-Ditylum_brightwellii.AAC.1